VSETRKLAAILVSDIVGYSRLAGADEDRILARLRTLRSDLIDPTIAVHHGHIIKRTGDGSVVEFRSVVDAVNCAIEVQRAMVERNAEVAPDKRIEFRIGIHLGDVVEESDGDLMGDGVNIAARLQSIAKPGAICLSEDAYRQVKGRLDLAVTDLGNTPLKNIAEPVHAYSVEVGKQVQAKPIMSALGRRRSLLVPLAAALATLLMVIAGGAWWFLNANRPASVAAKAPAEAARLSIAVLPFANLSGDPAQDYLVDALTDELITGLARIRDSFVIARNTAMTFKGAAGRRQGDRQGTRGALCSRRLGAAEQRSDEGQRPTHRRRQWRSPLGRTIRHAPRRSVADAGRDRRASGARNRPSTHLCRERTHQTEASGQSRRRGLGSPMQRGHTEGRMDRQGGRCSIRAL
jgi:adenylate cyclase